MLRTKFRRLYYVRLVVVDLNNFKIIKCKILNLDEENIFVSKTRSGKSRVPLKKPPKSKVKTTRSTTKKGEHLSLEEAMAHALETLEEIEPPTTLPLPKAKNSRAKKTAISKVKHVHTDVDLTGGLIPPHSTSTARHVSIDVDLTGGATPPHSTSPLFQPRKKYIEPNIDLFDIDSVNVKLKIDEIIEVHTIRKHQKFLNIFKAIADGHKISINDVLIYNNSKRIHHDDTPHSIAYRASIFLSEY